MGMTSTHAFKAHTKCGTRSYKTLGAAMSKSRELVSTDELLIIDTPTGERRFISTFTGFVDLTDAATHLAAQRYNAKRKAAQS